MPDVVVSCQPAQIEVDMHGERVSVTLGPVVFDFTFVEFGDFAAQIDAAYEHLAAHVVSESMGEPEGQA